jgi:uncharacterized protein Smg (DUF494 family)
MRPRVMDAVGFIGKFVTDHWESLLDQDEIRDELINLGFSSREISDAFRWIEKNTLGANEDVRVAEHAPATPMRVLSPAEQTKINRKCHGMLMSYYERGIIDALLLEEIVERVMKSDTEECDDKQLRRLAALCIFTRVQAEWREFLHSTNTLVH